ncbi:alpha-N-acetylgalactosaminidase-like [Homarus americanus]|uniref:alpha-N-acetylgalactosaminidase-like n=1 Tax=Homarus americanus TaxID=6706 RepID=UPI001C45E478|nr:alpha-N-acetylgalactosaminidase-like [Homarus americanus]
MKVQVLVCMVMVGMVAALDNGLARTPPMGWLAWERFRCNIDCENDPHNCISESLLKNMADMMVSEGYRDLGYNVVSLDDCWPAHERDQDGKLQPDPQRFPSGLGALADYMHERGLKFGIYEDYGTLTCGGYPGILGHLETDAQTFADWGVDYVKLDGCNADPKDMDEGYPSFGDYLNKTGRPMVYSCSWPVYQQDSGITPNWTSIIETCNLWRNYNDIQDSWSSVANIINHYGDNQDKIVPNAGPGHWNDPDMLIIGNFGLSYEQSKTQMAIWAVMAAPLLMSVDLRDLREEYKAILQNKALIAVNQDELGIQGRRVYKAGHTEMWTRPITPVHEGNRSYALVVLNQGSDGTPAMVTVKPSSLGLTYPAGYEVVDLYTNVNHGTVLPDGQLTFSVNPSGVVVTKWQVVMP